MIKSPDDAIAHNGNHTLFCDRFEQGHLLLELSSHCRTSWYNSDDKQKRSIAVPPWYATYASSIYCRQHKSQHKHVSLHVNHFKHAWWMLCKTQTDTSRDEAVIMALSALGCFESVTLDHITRFSDITIWRIYTKIVPGQHTGGTQAWNKSSLQSWAFQ